MAICHRNDTINEHRLKRVAREKRVTRPRDTLNYIQITTRALLRMVLLCWDNIVPAGVHNFRISFFFLQL